MATSIKLHDDIYHRKSGETIEVSDAKAEWAVANGYASLTAGGAAQQRLADANDVPMKKHQQNPDVRKDDKPNEGLAEALAEGHVLVPQDADADALPEGGVPEVENVDGDPAKAERGSQALERKAASQNPEDAPEQTNPAPVVAPVDEAADKEAAKVEKELAARTEKPAADDSAK